MDNKKLIIIDVGCRWGFADEFVSNIDEFQIYGFDPDPIECARLNAKYNHPSIQAIPLGLGDSAGKKVLYLTKEPACSSLYQPDPFLTGNYAAFHCEVEVGKSIVDVVSLDQWCRENKVDWIDHLKIDTQGSELDILKGASDVIKTVRSIEVEVEFNPMYIGQPLFHDVDRFLRDQGFELWKFSEITHYSRNGRPGDAINSVDIRYDDWHSNPAKVYAGQLFWANAHYVRRGISSQWHYSAQYLRDARLFSILGMPDVLGDQAAWGDEILGTIEKWIDRSKRVDRPILEMRMALQHAEAQAVQATERAEQAESRAQKAEGQLQSAEFRAQQIEVNLHQIKLQLHLKEHEVNEWHSRLLQLHRSTSWRVTRPIRVTKRLLMGDQILLQKLREMSLAIVKQLIKKPFIEAMSFVLKRPALKYKISQALKTLTPHLYNRLRMLRRTQSQNEFAALRFHSERTEHGAYYGKKVAVLVPLSAPGVTGGAERFYTGLKNALQQQGCVVEIVGFEVDESSFDNIKKAYEYFSKLKLDDFDLVISTKAPTYVVNHPNHVLYLVHTMRVFYDMFDETFPQANANLKAQREWIHAQDTTAFSRIKHCFSIGSEVSQRLIKWNNCKADVIHPPVDISGLYDRGVGDYFYMPGRLHAWKRVDLAIRAIQLSNLPMRLVISGTGEAELQLRKLAGSDPRIEFLGQVDDETLKRLYSEALAVPFLPIREDYGYVTLEAFASGKPVITCSDSGEPARFVKDGVTGRISSPEPEDISRVFEQLWNDRQLAARMGRAGRESIAEMSWVNVARRLLQAGFSEINISTARARPPIRVAILDMQPIIPAIGGGRLRLLGLYHALGADIRARYVGTYDWPGERFRRHLITQTLEEIDVPLSSAHHKAAIEAKANAGGKTVIDLLFSQQAHLSPEYLAETFDAIKWADVVVFSHPWVSPLVKDELLEGKTILYDSHNVEAALRAKLLDLSSQFEKNILDEVVRAERSAGRRADLILTCSREDMNDFVERYGWDRNRIRLVPNGVFSQQIQPSTEEYKREIRNAFGIPQGAFVGIFLGSDYYPNIEAGQYIIKELAPHLPEIMFIIVGGVCSRLGENKHANVRLIGMVEESEKIRWLQGSDFALNPMLSGSGTNIKMFDFMAAGLPVVATPMGARGIAQKSSAGLLLAARGELLQTIRKLSLHPDAARAGGLDNRDIVRRQYAWESISPELGRTIRSAHFRKRGAALLAQPKVTTKLRVAHLSTVGLKCGVGEYTRKIIDIYQRHGISNFIMAARAANEEPDLSSFREDAKISWFYDNVDWLRSKIQPEALDSMLEWGATNLIVQYHPGFYSCEALYNFVAQVEARGVSVTIVIHKFMPEAASTFRALNDLGVIVFSHRMTEIAQARAHGVSFDYLPIGIDAAESPPIRSISSRDFIENPPVITITGFLRQHKGTLSLIRAMPAVIKKYPGAKLQILCAVYLSADSRLELDRCIKEIARLDLEKNIVVDSIFHDKAYIYAELAKADLAVLPYENSTEGGSASASDCMAVGLPLIVSDADIFDEIRDIVITTKPDPDSISDAVLNIFAESGNYAFYAERSASYAWSNSLHNIVGALLAASI